MKTRIKNRLLIESRAFAELYLQTHHFPSLPLLLGANFIFSLTVSPKTQSPLTSIYFENCRLFFFHLFSF